MKIGQVSFSYKPIRGGAETYLAQLNQVLVNSGHEVKVFQPDTGVRDPEIVPVRLRYPRLPNLINFNLSLLSYRRELLDQDLLIVHYPEHFWPLLWHPKVVTLTHGVNWDFDRPLRRLSRILMAKLAFGLSWKFVANDTNFLREVGVRISPKEKMFQAVGRRQYFIPNCIDTAQFKRSPIPSDLKEKELLIVPRNFTYPRGVDLAIGAMALLKEGRPNLQLLLVGDALTTADSQQFKEQLHRQVKDLGLERKVIFYGSRPRAEMPGIYSAGLVTVIPTRGNEGTSLSALESMAVGTPVVTTAVAGLQDLPSYQCQPDAQSIAAAIEDVLSDRDRFAKEQNQAVKETYNLNRWTSSWLEVIGQ